MSDHLERVTAYLDALDNLGDVGPEYIDPEIIAGAPTHDAPYLSGSDLRALVADAQQLRAQGTEVRRAELYRTFIAAMNGCYRKAEHGWFTQRCCYETGLAAVMGTRPVGEWRKVGGEHG